MIAARAFEPGDVIEECPVLRVSSREHEIVQTTRLASYFYEWGRGAAIALGYGSLYNHAPDPNARAEARLEEGVLVVRARRPIAADEEITLHYLDGTGDETALGFAVRD